MPISTPHLIIGVILLNLIFSMAVDVTQTYETGNTNTQTKTNEILSQINNQNQQLDNVLLKTDSSGNPDLSGMLRSNSGETPQFAEAGINLGSNMSFWGALTISAIFPYKLGDMVTQAFNEGATMIGIAYGIISLFILGINLQLYKRFYDIAITKLQG